MYTCLGEDIFREPASGPKQKLGAKGNITAFMIPWEKIYSMLKGLESTDTVLPRCGSALSEIIVVTFQRGQGPAIGTFLAEPTGVALAAPKSHITAMC